MSVITITFGLTEPLFVLECWYPPSLFDLPKVVYFNINNGENLRYNYLTDLHIHSLNRKL
ncbi:hypothetical protein LV84_03684 [Algoriphagus ratkowskyi]|uniref:Uncharacterized protein n=1 Tax=Algoriphagus ratkowskyi TaxID=57028 RepID=A0A2W7R6Z1_9BACT|nr:hypothetical protein LV84_03684 [Algoriphagus ratkowskyi]